MRQYTQRLHNVGKAHHSPNSRSTAPRRDTYDGSLDLFQRTMLGIPSTTMSEDCYVNAVAPPGGYMRHVSESTTYLDVQGLFTGPGEYDTYFDDTNSLGLGGENFGLESWNTASSKPAIVNRSQWTSKCNPQFPRATNNQATFSSSTNTGGSIQSDKVVMHR